MHLMTTEALRIFLDNLKPEGLLAFHVSNLHLNLENVVSTHADKFGLANVIEKFRLKKKTPLLHYQKQCSCRR
jgi:hypothetical protein